MTNNVCKTFIGWHINRRVYEDHGVANLQVWHMMAVWHEN